MKLLAALVIAAGTVSPFLAQAGEFDAQIKAHIESSVKPWLSDPVVIKAIKAQNETTAGYDAAKIDELDKQWRAEAKAKGGPLIASVDATELSAFLKKKDAAASGLYGEIFVMDAKGLNVGQTSATSDYLQGDEPKFQKSFGAGPDGLLIDNVEFDESAGAFFAQTSVTIVDPSDRKPIGAITLGIQVEKLPK